MIDEATIRSLRESYRRIAFPKGGSRALRTRDKQTAALVARGGMYACQALLELIQRKLVAAHLAQRTKRR